MPKMNPSFVEILDTTLRDGEQTPGVAFSPAEKLAVARLLKQNLKVDRLEIGSARVSEGEAKAVRDVLRWADSIGCLNDMELLGFVDGGKSIEWICHAGGRVVNLLAKGSLRHCEVQLRKEPAQHFSDVCRDIELALKAGLLVNLYLEDWTNGMKDSRQYVTDFMNAVRDSGVARVMLPDTLGIADPDTLAEEFSYMRQNWPDVRFDFHGHNDYGLVTANSLVAVKAGISGIHTTINGLGERTGNQPLSQLVVCIADMTDFQCRVDEKELLHATSMVQNISGKRTAWNSPVTGSDVFTQTCGVHADGDKKGGLYVNRLLPERFGRKRNYALGKLSGKASLDKNLEELKIELTLEQRDKVLNEIVRLGDRKKSISAADLPFLIADALRTPLKQEIRVAEYRIATSSDNMPNATVKVEYQDKLVEESSDGDGGYDAFVKALRKALKALNLEMPTLLDYEVRIPPGGRTDALVETTILWSLPDEGTLVSTGVDCDQMVAAIIATEKMLNLLMQHETFARKTACSQEERV